MAYAWVCNECDKQFPCDGHGFNDINIHGKQEHKLKPGAAVRGVVDLDTGEVVLRGWSPTVLKKARALGYASDGDPAAISNRQSQNKIVPMETTRRSMGRGRIPTDANRVGKMTIIAENIRLDPMIYFLFLQAKQRWPGKYKGVDGASISQFILDCGIVFAMEMQLTGAQMMVDAVRQSVTTGFEGDQDGTQ